MIKQLILAFILITLFSCNRQQERKVTQNTVTEYTKPDTLIYWVPGILPDYYWDKAEKWAAKKYGFIIYHPGCEITDSIEYNTNKNNEKLFAWLDKKYHIPDEKTLQKIMSQYVQAVRDIQSVIDGYIEKRKLKDADFTFDYKDSTQNEFLILLYYYNKKEKAQVPGAVLRVNTVTKKYEDIDEQIKEPTQLPTVKSVSSKHK